MRNLRKQVISVLLCLVMIVGMIPVTNLQAAKKQDTTYYQDYERAFWNGYLPEKYKKQKKTKQVTFEEYRDMLRYVIKQQKGNLKAFDKNVKKANRKLTRGEGIIMSWYAANALGASFWQYDSNDVYYKDSFWDMVDDKIIKKEFPNALKAKKVKDDMGNVWDSEYIAAYLWNAMHSSVYSEIPVVDFDNTKDMQTMKAFTMENAVCAVTRIVDGIHADTNILDGKLSYKKNYVKITDKKATTPTLNLKKKAKVKSIEKLPRLTGFVLDIYYGDSEKIPFKSEDVANIANWGFTSARVMFDYRALFNKSVDMVDLNQLERLDELVAAAEHYGIHLNVLMCQLPGRVYWDDENYNSGGEFDLFVNPKKQKEVCEIWEMITSRYKDVPGDYLSYTPVWEVMNKNMSTGAEVPDYTVIDYIDTLDKIIDSMRKKDKNCFIFYELPSGDEDFTNEDNIEAYNRIQNKYNNTLVSYNYCEGPFVYHNMTVEEGANIDNNNHSMYLPEYPNVIYSARIGFCEDSTMTMDGFLPKDTKITLYLSQADGHFVINADNQKLYEETFNDKKYQTSYLLSGYYPYATSDKKITLQLKADVSKLTFECNDGWIGWSGMDVTLPKEYAKKKWYSISTYDRFLQGDTSAYRTKYEKRTTSNIMICPNDFQSGNHLTIHKNLTYTSESVLYQFGEKYSNNWGKLANGLSKNCIIRYESAPFSLGITQKSMLSYYDTLLKTFDKYNFNWYSNDYDIILTESEWKTPDAKLVKHGKYDHFNMELLKLLQKHR